MFVKAKRVIIVGLFHDLVALDTEHRHAVKPEGLAGGGGAVGPGARVGAGEGPLKGDRIEIRDVSGDLPSVQVGLAWRKGAPLSAVARNFIRAAQGAVPER